MQITADTGYPFEEQVRLRLSVSNAVAFPLKLRIPGWATNATVTVNGQAQAGVVAGSFLTLSNTWMGKQTLSLVHAAVKSGLLSNIPGRRISHEIRQILSEDDPLESLERLQPGRSLPPSTRTSCSIPPSGMTLPG